jgi:hypothetical protein
MRGQLVNSVRAIVASKTMLFRPAAAHCSQSNNIIIIRQHNPLRVFFWPTQIRQRAGPMDTAICSREGCIGVPEDLCMFCYQLGIIDGHE